jgi:hypothetical protein
VYPAHRGHGEKDWWAPAGVRGKEWPGLSAYCLFLLSCPKGRPARLPCTATFWSPFVNAFSLLKLVFTPRCYASGRW